jgi:hypothetical protein
MSGTTHQYLSSGRCCSATAVPPTWSGLQFSFDLGHYHSCSLMACTAARMFCWAVQPQWHCGFQVR